MTRKTLPLLDGARSLVSGGQSPLTDRLRQARADWPVALVTMPFVSHRRPSIQLGLLKPIAESYGFPTKTFHLNLHFAQQIGVPTYEALCEFGRCFPGDWLFSAAAFGDRAPDKHGQFLAAFEEELYSLLVNIDRGPEYLLEVRDKEVPRFLDSLMEEVPWATLRVVGFTSTFQQNVASFALASQLKREYPHLVLVFGGANFEDEMGLELVRSMSCIDYAVVGEGDRAFAELLVALQEERDPAKVAGVAHRAGDTAPSPTPRPQFSDLDSLPAPDYEEFFERSIALNLLPPGPKGGVMIPFESARGCWWGQKHHCTFCGLNGGTMRYRSKSPGRMQSELQDAARRYGVWRFAAVDNILDMSYLDTLFPQLIADAMDFEFFYELKANLTREQLRVLSRAGVRNIQPGIESLSTPVLKLMRKGITAIQNVNTLRWAHYYDISVHWNLLYGFPGETVADYRDQDDVIRQIGHLPPPTGVNRIWMERFSPLFIDRDLLPLEYMRPHGSYQYIYPPEVDLDAIAYFFEYQFSEQFSDEEVDVTRDLVRAWQAGWREEQHPTLTFRAASDFLQIQDQRHPDNYGTYTFRGPLAAIYTATSNRPRSAASLKQELRLPWPVEEVEEALDEFTARGLMMRDKFLFLSLALPASPGR